MTPNNTPRALSVFLVESMNPSDIYKGMLEGEAIVQVLKLLRVAAVYKTVIDKKRLVKALSETSKGGFSVFHLSCHANTDDFGLASGDTVTWTELASLAQDKLRNTVLCLSACEAGNIAIANALKRQKCHPCYIVGPEGKPDYAQACVAWSVFYHCLAAGRGIEQTQMRRALDRMNDAVDSDFLYRRWTRKMYRRYPRKKR